MLEQGYDGEDTSREFPGPRNYKEGDGWTIR